MWPKYQLKSFISYIILNRIKPVFSIIRFSLSQKYTSRWILFDKLFLFWAKKSWLFGSLVPTKLNVTDDGLSNKNISVVNSIQRLLRHLSHGHNSPSSNSATQHTDIYRGNSTLTLLTWFALGLVTTERFICPTQNLPDCPKTTIYWAFTAIFL